MRISTSSPLFLWLPSHRLVSSHLLLLVNGEIAKRNVKVLL